MGVWTETKVLDSLTGVLWTTEEESVGTSWRAHGELVNCEALTTSLGDPGTGGSGEAKSGDGDLWNLQKTVVVGDGTDKDDGLALVGLGRVWVGGGANNAGNGHWWAVDLGHHQSAQHDLVEVGVGAAGEESVELDEERNVWVVALCDLAVAALDVVTVCIVLVV